MCVWFSIPKSSFFECIKNVCVLRLDVKGVFVIYLANELLEPVYVYVMRVFMYVYVYVCMIGLYAISNDDDDGDDDIVMMMIY